MLYRCAGLADHWIYKSAALAIELFLRKAGEILYLRYKGYQDLAG